MTVARSFSGDTKVLDDNMLYIIYSEPINIQGGPKSWTFSTHHIFGTIQEKMKQTSPKCFQGFWEQRLDYSFYVAVKYFFL